jgi:hypothetical protein
MLSILFVHGLYLLSKALVLVKLARSPKASSKLGDDLYLILRKVYGEKHAKRVFEPAIADMQHEYDEALARGAGRFERAWMRWRGYFVIAKTSGLLSVVTVLYRIIRTIVQ